MSKLTLIACDWPGCEAQAKSRAGGYSRAPDGWFTYEMRGTLPGSWTTRHYCPSHRQEAIADIKYHQDRTDRIEHLCMLLIGWVGAVAAYVVAPTPVFSVAVFTFWVLAYMFNSGGSLRRMGRGKTRRAAWGASLIGATVGVWIILDPSALIVDGPDWMTPALAPAIVLTAVGLLNLDPATKQEAD